MTYRTKCPYDDYVYSIRFGRSGAVIQRTNYWERETLHVDMQTGRDAYNQYRQWAGQLSGQWSVLSN